MDCRLREIPLIVIVISLRICDRVEEALSLTLPNLSRYTIDLSNQLGEDKDISRQFGQGRILDFLIVHGLEEAYDVIDRLQGTFEVEQLPFIQAKYLPAESVSRNSARRRNNWRGIPCLRVGYG